MNMWQYEYEIYFKDCNIVVHFHVDGPADEDKVREFAEQARVKLEASEIVKIVRKATVSVEIPLASQSN